MLILHQNTLHVAYLPFVKQVLLYTHTHTRTSTVLSLKSKFPDSAVFFKWQLPVPPHTSSYPTKQSVLTPKIALMMVNSR